MKLNTSSIREPDSALSPFNTEVNKYRSVFHPDPAGTERDRKEKRGELVILWNGFKLEEKETVWDLPQIPGFVYGLSVAHLEKYTSLPSQTPRWASVAPREKVLLQAHNRDLHRAPAPAPSLHIHASAHMQGNLTRSS